MKMITLTKDMMRNKLLTDKKFLWMNQIKTLGHLQQKCQSLLPKYSGKIYFQTLREEVYYKENQGIKISPLHLQTWIKGCGTRSRSNKCILSEMEQSESLDEPFMDFDTQDSSKVNSGQSNNDDISSTLAFSTIVFALNKTSHSTSNTFSIREHSPSRVEYTRESFSESSVENTHLQNFRASVT
jgi:hypothetical protein